jgi:hypothetical protein
MDSPNQTACNEEPQNKRIAEIFNALANAQEVGSQLEVSILREILFRSPEQHDRYRPVTGPYLVQRQTPREDSCSLAVNYDVVLNVAAICFNRQSTDISHFLHSQDISRHGVLILPFSRDWRYSKRSRGLSP